MNLNELKHSGLKKWVEEAVALMTPDRWKFATAARPNMTG